MGIEFRSQASADNISGTSITISVPAGAQEGDLLLASVYHRTDEAITPNESGWTAAGANSEPVNSPAGGRRLAVFFRTATASEPASYQFNWDSNVTGNQGDMLCFTNTEGATAFEDCAYGFADTGGGTMTIPGVTTVTTGTMLVAVACGTWNGGTLNWSGWTGATSVRTLNGGNVVYGLAYKAMGQRGDTGNVVTTCSPSVAAALIALRPEPEVNPGTDSLVSWWKLDETSGTRYDSHGSNHLTDNNTVLYGAGVQGNAADFEADAGEYLEITDAAQIGLDLGQSGADFTICLWLKPETLPLCHIVSRYGNTGNRSYLLGGNGATLTFYVSHDGSAEVSVANSSALTSGVWTFVCARYENGVGLSLRTDGNADATQADVGGNLYNTSTGYDIARRAAGGGLSYDGMADEVAIYSRLLSDAEIAWLYNDGNGRTYEEVSAAGGAGSLLGIGGRMIRGVWRWGT